MDELLVSKEVTREEMRRRIENYAFLTDTERMEAFRWLQDNPVMKEEWARHFGIKEGDAEKSWRKESRRYLKG